MPVAERKPMHEEPWVTLAVAARELTCTRTKVLADALRGELESDHRGTWTFISRKSLDALKAKRAEEKKAKAKEKKTPRSRSS